MKTFSENKRAINLSVPILLLTVVGCFSLGLVAARFGASKPKPAPTLQFLPGPRPGVQPAQERSDTVSGQPPAPAPAIAPVPMPVTTEAAPKAALTPVAAPLSVKHGPTTGKAPMSPAGMPQSVAEQTDDFGKSVRGRPLRAFVLGNGSHVTMVFGDFHGNEPSTPGVVDNLHQYLRTNPDKWPDSQVILVPLSNPDGWAARTRVNAHGVDINRNFPGTWKAGARTARYSPGPKAGSEPETQAIIKLVEKYRPTKIVSIHQPFHMLNWTGQPGLELAKAMQRHNKYRISDDVGYATPGAFGDYCGIHHIAIVTLEMPPIGVSEGWQQNRDALMAAINLN